MATYMIQKGDTLTGIAKRHGVPDWRHIYSHPNNAALRRLSPDPDLIHPGHRLFLPEPPRKPPTAPDVFEIQVVDESAIAEAGSTAAAMLPGAAFANLTLTIEDGRGTRVEVKTDALGRVGLSGARLPVPPIRVTAIDDVSRTPAISYGSEGDRMFAANASQVILRPNKRRVMDAIAAAAPVARRGSWSKRTPKKLLAPDWDFDTVVLHHSGNTGEKNPLAIEAKHFGRDFDDIGYHYLITPNGLIHEGRALAFKGEHVKLANTRKVGILVMGDFENEWWDSDDVPTTAQLASVKALVAVLRRFFPTITKIGGHRDYGKTECPGAVLYKELPSLRTETKLGGP